MELKRGGRVRIQRQVIKFIALPFPFSSKLEIWSIHDVVVQGRQRNVQKSVSCCFTHKTCCDLDDTVAIVVS